MEDFYVARQKADENVVSWGCRLETALNRILEKTLLSGNPNDMLRSKFWSGLYDQQVKHALRHRFELGQDFHTLLAAARVVEHEIRLGACSTPLPKAKQAVVQAQPTPSLETQLKEITKKLDDMATRMKDLEKKSPSPSEPVERRSCFYCKERGHVIDNCLKRKKKAEKDAKAQAEN